MVAPTGGLFVPIVSILSFDWETQLTEQTSFAKISPSITLLR